MFLNTFNEFFKALTKPWPIFTLIANQELILEKFNLSSLECKILGKYIGWNSDNVAENI